MKRYISLFFIIIVSFLLQTTVFQHLALANVIPNLLLIVVVAIGYMRGQLPALFTGLFCGLLVDLCYGGIVGFYGLIYMVIGYLNGYANRIYYKDDAAMPLLLIAVSDFIYNFIVYILGFLLRNRLHFFFYCRTIMIPEMVYTVLVSVVFYKLLHKWNEWLEKWEKEG